MNEILLYTIISLSSIGLVAAVILYFVAQKFKVYEDPRIDMVEEILPAANCGGCGFAGCRNFAEALVKSDDIGEFYCPVGGNDTMEKAAKILGKETAGQEPKVAVVRCNGTCDHRPKTNQYDGAASCAISSALYSGDTGCQYGCLGYGDCEEACDFDAIHMNTKTGLPEVIDENCTACNACVIACPNDIIELRKRNKKDRKIFVSCINEDKGGVAKKNCEVACIGCSKCFKVCPFDAITMNNNLAYIDPDKCRLCRKCVPECPTNAIIEIGFPPPKPKQEKQAPAAKDNTKKDNTADIKAAESKNSETKTKGEQ
jgi:Na+-translocating ferredoxin:NAD+ oxidoreductase subunit B